MERYIAQSMNELWLIDEGCSRDITGVQQLLLFLIV